MVSRSNSALVYWAGTVAIVGLGLFLYVGSLWLQLFWDDVPHMQWLEAQRGGHYWLTSEGFPFYRPTAFTVWDTVERLVGHHDAGVLHSISVSVHIINAVLTMMLLGQMARRATSGIMAGLIFVAFPFSYQTVIPTAAHFHLWLALGILVAALALLHWLQHPKRHGMLMVVWMGSFWAIFSHESGVLTPVLLGGIIVVRAQRHWQASLRRAVIALGPVGLIASVYVVVWATIPKANDATSFQISALDVKIAQTLQGFSFPLAAILQAVVSPDSGTTLAWAGGGVSLAYLGIWIVHNRAAWRLLALFITWVPLVMMPAWLFLDVNYLLGSPRLHYVAAIGIACVWGIVLAQPLPTTTAPRLQVVAGGSMLIIILAISTNFVQQRVEEHRSIDQLYQDVGNIAATIDAESERLLLINGPAYLAPREPTFLLGAEGSTYLPNFITLQDWLALNRYQMALVADNRHAENITPPIEDIFAVTHPPIARETINAYSHVVQVQVWDSELRAVVTGRQLHHAVSDVPLGRTSIGINILEIGLSLTTSGYEGTIVWQVNSSEVRPPTSVFVHLLCDGQLVDQADGPPLGKLYPLSSWPPNTTWRDSRYFVPGPDVDKTCLQLFVGLFDPTTGERYRFTLLSDEVTEGVYAAID